MQQKWFGPKPKADTSPKAKKSMWSSKDPTPSTKAATTAPSSTSSGYNRNNGDALNQRLEQNAPKSLNREEQVKSNIIITGLVQYNI